MSSHKTDQYHVEYRGRRFHFVSYEARQANPRTGEDAMPATWFLMTAGKRWPVTPELPDQDPQAVMSAFTHWLDSHVFARTA